MLVRISAVVRRVAEMRFRGRGAAPAAKDPSVREHLAAVAAQSARFAPKECGLVIAKLRCIGHWTENRQLAQLPEPAKARIGIKLADWTDKENERNSVAPGKGRANDENAQLGQCVAK